MQELERQKGKEKHKNGTDIIRTVFACVSKILIWQFLDHPLIDRLSEYTEKAWSLFRDTSCWLPLPDSFMFQEAMPAGDQTMIATTAGLCKELERLSQMAWQTDEDTILQWEQTMDDPTDGAAGTDGVITMGAEYIQ